MKFRWLVLLPLAACAAPTPPVGLAGTSWVLHRAEEPAPSLEFSADGLRGSGFSGCNRFMGRVATGPDGALRFMGVAGTMMACAPETDPQEALVLEGLNNVRRIRRMDDRLEMLGQDGAVLLIWRRG